MTTASQRDPAALVRAIATQHAEERGALMPVLHEVTDELGHIAREDVETIADVLNLSVAEVHGVVSFYKDFRTEPPAAHIVALCRGEACQSVGAEALHAETRARASSLANGLANGLADGLGVDVEVDEVFCLGNCALGPSGTVDGRLYGRLSRERLDELTKGWR
jgi:formate dehydrogenase subunit gamma